MKRAYSIVCPSNNKQAKEIVPELEKMGYGPIFNRGNIKCLITYKEGGVNLFRTFSETWGNEQGKIILEEYNKDLILALASQYDGEEYHVGEWVTRNSTYYEWWRPGEIYKITRIEDNEKWIYVNNHDHDPNYIEHLRKATEKEVLNHFNNQTTKNQTVMSQKEKFTVSATSKFIKEAFVNELKERGYSAHSAKTTQEFMDVPEYCLTQVTDPSVKQFQRETERKSINYELPQSWNEALTAWEEYSKAPAKKKSEEFEITHEDGSLWFTVEQGKDIVVYETEQDMEDKNQLGTISKSQLEGIISQGKLGTWAGYEVMTDTISIGCKKFMSISDFERLLEVYNKVNS